MKSASERFVQFLQDAPYRLSLTREEADLTATVSAAERFHPAGALLFEEGQETAHTRLFIVSGWALSFKSMASGQRAVADLLQRGDLVSADSSRRRVHTSVQATTDVTTFEIHARKPISSMRLVDLMLDLETRNADIAVEHLVNISRRRPIERTACLFLETAYRYEQAGYGSADRFTLPFTQRDLADLLGLTSIHTNRVLRSLRERGLLRFHHWTVELVDRPALLDISGFDPSYLKFSAGTAAPPYADASPSRQP